MSSDVPLEVADPTNLSDAAAFAWGEFIALTWPALPQGQDNAFPRGMPDTSLKYGDKGKTGQVVWETFRHRVEAFPGQGNPNGYDPTKPPYGFAAQPDYVYTAGTQGIPPDGHVPPHNPNWNPKIPPFNNMDEVTQIGLDAMYAGTVAPSPNYESEPTNSTNVKEKILFEAKVNEVVYQYAAQPRTVIINDPKNPGNKCTASNIPYSYFQSNNACVVNIKTNSVGYLQTGNQTNNPPPYINVPSSDPAAGKAGSIEVKASFRRLGPNDDPTKYYTANVRYYTSSDGGTTVTFKTSDDPTVNEVWGLTSLHIIQKTPNAPTFVFATFGHIDNILDAMGNDVEDSDGTTKQAYLNSSPFLPALTITPSKDGRPQQVVVTGNGMPPVNTSSHQLYFNDFTGGIYTDAAMTKPYSLPINVSRRIFPIPPTITAANRAAQDAIRAANPDAVWKNYRLIGVQARPLDVNTIPTDEETQATFYLSNEVVETNPTLQHFSGRFDNKAGNATNFESQWKGLLQKQPCRPFNRQNRRIHHGRLHGMPRHPGAKCGG